jgi:hypothetical protein
MNMHEPKPRNLTAAQAFTQKVRTEARDKSTAIGAVVDGLVGDISAARQPKRAPLSAQLSKLSPAQLEKVEDLVASERTRRYDAEADAEYGDDDGDFSEDDDEDASYWIDPVPDDQIAERKAEYDAAEFEKMSPAARAALEIVEDAARLVPEQ